MKFFSDLFASFDQQDSLVFLLFVLVSFLIGFVLSWLISNRKAAQFKKEAQKAQAEYKALEAEYQSFKEQFDLREADLQEAQVEVEEAKRRIRNLLEEGRQQKAELDETQAELVRLEAAVTSQQVTIEDLNDQILGMRFKSGQVVEDTEQLLDAGPESEASLEPEEPMQEVSDSLKAFLESSASEEETPEEAGRADEGELPREPVDTVAAMQSAFNAALQRLNSVEEKIQRLEAENVSLRNQIQTAAPSRSLESSVEELFEFEDEEEDEEERVLQASTYLDTAIGTVLPEASEEDKDDLKKIEGIGTYTEKQLNDLGLYTYEQISKLDEVLIEQLTAAIQFFPGRIVKDDWVGQAARLASGDPEEALSTEEPEESSSDEEETPVAEGKLQSLQLIEGIGPKIEALLVEAGIHNLNDLADTEVERLQEILAAAGERFRLHNPATWPEQARLATAGEWDALREFKDYLDGGKHPE